MIYWVCYRNHMPNLPLVTWTNPCQHLRLMVLRTCPTMPDCQEKTFSDICLQYAFTFVLNLHQRLVSADYFQDFINDCCQVDGQPFFNFLRLMKWLLFMCSTHFNAFQSIFFHGGLFSLLHHLPGTPTKSPPSPQCCGPRRVLCLWMFPFRVTSNKKWKKK